MGNVNEKNAGQPSTIPLDPKGHFDPWTDKEEARAMESKLHPGMESRYPPTPPSESPPQFEQEEGAPSVVNKTPPMFAFSRNEYDYNNPESVDETKDSKECEDEETGNTSLPLSDSVIPETFETDIAGKNPTSALQTSASITGSVLESIEEIKAEDSSSFIVDANILEDVGVLSHPVLSNADKGAVPVPQLTIKEIKPKSPFIEPNVSNDPKPTTTCCDIFLREQLPDAQILSPLILGSPALPMVEGFEAPVPIAFKEQHNVPVANFSVSTGPTLEPENLAEDNDHNLLTKDSVNNPVHDDHSLVRSTPHMKTIPLPDLEHDPKKYEVTNPFKDDGTASTVPCAEMALLPLTVVSSDSILLSSSLSLLSSPTSPPDYVPDECTAENSSQTLMVSKGANIGLCRPNSELTLIDRTTFDTEFQESCHISDGPVACVAPYATTDLPTHHPAKNQAEDLERQIFLLQEAITTLAISTMGPTLNANNQKGYNEMITLQTTTKDDISTAISETNRPTPILPDFATHVDSTNIPTQSPNFAQELLANNQSSLIDDRSVRLADVGGGSEHTADKPNWANAPLEGCSPARKTTTTRAPAGHTRDRPNWAQAPSTEVIMASENRGAQKEKERRRRAHKGKKNCKDVTIDAIPTPSTEPSPVLVTRTPCVGQIPFPSFPVENPRSMMGVTQPLQFKPTAEHQKVAANRRKVSSWIISSVSAMDSPESDDKSSAATVSGSAYMLDSVSARGIGDDVEDHSRKEPLSPATKMANALIAREASKLREEHVLNKGLGAGISLVQGQRDDSRVEPSALYISPKPRKNKGKKAMIRRKSPPAAVRQRRESSTSAQSTVSVRSAVSTSGRIFQLAMQDLGVSRQALAGDQDGISRDIGFQDETTLEEVVSKLNFGTDIQKSSHTVETLTPVAKPVVMFPDSPITLERSSPLTPRSKGKVKAPVTIREKVKLDKDSQDCAQFPFSFKASGPLTTDKVQAEDHGRAGLDGNPNQLRFSRSKGCMPNNMSNAKLSSVPTPKTFVPQGKYVPPPVRENQMHGQDRTPGYGASCAQSVPQPSQAGGNTLVNASTHVTQDTCYLESRCTGTSTYVYSQPAPSAIQLGSTLLSSAPHHELNPHFDMNLNAPTPTLHSDANAQRSNWGTQQDYRTTQAQAPQQQIMSDLAMTQEIFQRNMEDIIMASHEYSMFGDYQSTINNRNNGPIVQPLQTPQGVPIRGEPRRYVQPPMLRQNSMYRIERTNANPPHLQTQVPPQLTQNAAFAEYSRRLRQETRTALESVPSRLPRRRRT